ncbi:MAG: DUF928 domain-containing protein [candidate division NC10 bacterium]|nr:DUF928 domain-containing protein [candidate division NC10 bacterium]
MSKYWAQMVILAMLLLACRVPALWAQSGQAVAVITELKFNRGDIQITAPGKKAPEKPAPLQSLYPGTQIVVTKDAAAVILFTEGMKTVTIGEKNSPFNVKPPEAKGGSSGVGVTQVASLLLGKKKPPTYIPLAVRGGKHPPTLIAPRDTKLMTDSPTFKWMGMEMQAGTLRLYGPAGQIWVAENIARTQIKYPSTEPRLNPGVEYSWSIEKAGFPAEKARFTVLSPSEARTVQEQVKSLEATAELPDTTLAILKASLLISHGLFYEAREVLVAAETKDPDEPTVHLLLGETYEKTGLKNLALEEYAEAQFLSRISQ